MTTPYNNASSYPFIPQHQSIDRTQMYVGQPNVNPNFPQPFRTDQNQQASQQTVTYVANNVSSPGVSQLNGPQFSTQQTVSRFPPIASSQGVPQFSQFPPPPVNTVFAPDQHYNAIPPQMPRTTMSQPSHFVSTNVAANSVMTSAGSAPNPPNWFTPNTFNYPVYSNNAVPSYTPNPTEIPPRGNTTVPVTPPVPVFPGSVRPDFQSQTQPLTVAINTTQQYVPIFPNCAMSVQPVANVHYQQIKSPKVTDVPHLRTAPQSTFLGPQNMPSVIPPTQNSNNYPQSTYAPILLPNTGFQLQSTIVKPRPAEENTDENLIRDFIAKARLKDATSKEDKFSCTTIPEFQWLMKTSISLLTKLAACKNDLKDSINLDEETWRKKCNYIKDLKEQFSEVQYKLSSNKNLSHILIKLKKRAQKRKKIRARKERYNHLKREKKQDRLLLHQKIDVWLETLREKDLQQKKEGEMRKEADSILSEVRRKIQEAKRAIEKLKIFLKLRQARKEHAQKKGMFIHSKSDAIFENKVAEMKEVMQKQLVEYEAEEKALKVMLETEQEGQLEAEAQWKSKQLRKHQEKKCNAILECLFGRSEEPSPNDPLYFFWQHYNAANCDINNLLKIRHDWDIFLVPRDTEEGSGVPLHWVNPEAPTSDAWSLAL